MVGDPIGDFINRIKNASKTDKKVVSAPYSKIKESVANLLKKEGYVGFVDVKGKGVKKTLELGLVSKKDGTPAISGARRLSKPGRRIYKGAGDIRPVKFGHGRLVLSTPEGVISGGEAKKKRVGGELLFEIW
ncbi:30S ribosomal protein S8 [Candidatus Campbellbacteria bacterium CG11_big_fil_rev_8_21_14_0_20_44_21]|uniref:Small ribosomal subunit protein uS8 n=1 Tax=Candidatus Campbellbacteria bacterium CG22_combo_CG10-13_8_21_14_all_43_18 TaxID=1974530 RepID=A0A2H0DY59_9BACT|nr:MAG: 30S ribosomal protein S8 [Candidatus Campbellbacteria bacterium CG22_combo_CG10-13_8_21_14_all_43_18]PIR24345.1 MAG: 30S ribosomal protein S8 [Candidatus Campbellbacteria bacterium CG11_big_fil_rev_8_21_14_0_20_44_21]